MRYDCESCGKAFTKKDHLNRHAHICSSREIHRLNSIILDLKEEQEEHRLAMELEYNEFASLKMEYEKVASELAELKTSLAVTSAEKSIYKNEYEYFKAKPTTITNTNTNTINNKLKAVNTSTIDPLTIDFVKTKLVDYTYATFITGEIGIKQFILALIVKDDEMNYVSTDTSRSNFHRYFEKGLTAESKKWTDDKGALFLANVFRELKPNVELYWERLREEIKNARSTEEHEALDKTMKKVKPMVFAICDGADASKYHNMLLGNVIKYIKPHVGV